MSLIKKVIEEFSKLYEKVSIDPSDDEVVKIKVDDSDDKNITYKESENPFSMVQSIKVEVEIEEDEDSPDSPYIDNLKEAIKKRKIKTR